MRTLIAALVLAAVGGAAAAQPYFGLTQSLDAQRDAAAQAQRSRDIAAANDLSVLQSRVQTDETLSGLAASRGTAPGATVPFSSNFVPPKLEMSQMVQIPDAELAASNARAVAASENRR
ncbi:MAG TPA: hypothetical protein VKQ54_12430 [Caulobacteraceae bacterium]|jgi:hypothetical protein|uniref:hypothetical protein n=1 Tax=Phenylobacterium sp. TaxID=1871053 RepID=UPI002B5EC7B7|nr:hypothetical protein [Phenylobacterium sp.]HLZ84366.1 hypothetical protein [Caulobacteraceae bacterium]HXA40746.1 hypothetical protein [Phenylobacterium sp.]